MRYQMAEGFRLRSPLACKAFTRTQLLKHPTLPLDGSGGLFAGANLRGRNWRLLTLRWSGPKIQRNLPSLDVLSE